MLLNMLVFNGSFIDYFYIFDIWTLPESVEMRHHIQVTRDGEAGSKSAVSQRPL